MQIVPLLAECGLSRTVDEKLQSPGAPGVCLCTPVGTDQLSTGSPVMSVTSVLLMLDQCGCLLADNGLAAAAV